ncbi:hypothetical protein [Nocardioides sambongensis]|uniref:hypothetical protein n=1 Tax=Nocardioides sambongensis TaxID=2589074 RepID=UPI00112B1E1F|nr:hypothetical protein [Nocardioides sambongensis]
MSANVSVRVPRGWPTRRDAARGIVLAARAPGGAPGGVGAATVVVRAVDVPEPGLGAWRSRALDDLARSTDAFTLEDDDSYDLADQPVRYHRFAHRDGFTELLSEQWCWWVDGVGITVSCTVGTELYPLYCELFEEVADSVRIGAAAA